MDEIVKETWNTLYMVGTIVRAEDEDDFDDFYEYDYYETIEEARKVKERRKIIAERANEEIAIMKVVRTIIE